MPFNGFMGVSQRSPNEPDGHYDFTCGHCNKEVNAVVGATYSTDLSKNPHPISIRFLICPSCSKGSVVNADGIVYPGTLFGQDISYLPSEVESDYQEARRDMSVNSYTSCELICRKILMRIAVDKGAKEGERFEEYINYLENQDVITKSMKKWVDLIRKNANESTHKLPAPMKERAESTLMFTGELLKLTYEVEGIANKYTITPQETIRK